MSGRLIRELVLLVAILVIGCASSAPSAPSAPSAVPSRSVALTQVIASPSPATPTATAQLACPERVLAGMSTDQRIGQLFLMGLARNQLGAGELAAIRDLHVGSVWFSNTTDLGVAEIRHTTDAVQEEASQAATAGVRFFVAVNQEGGLVQALRGPGFSSIPSALKQGELPAEDLRMDAALWGAELARAGINLDYAPVADVVPLENIETNEPIGVLEREFGDDPRVVGNHAAAFAAGLADAGVAATAKHFPGLGRVLGNTDFSSGVVDEVTTMTDPYLEPFATLIADRIPFVMVALATYTEIDPEHLAVFSPAVMGDLLRVKLGFTGAVMSDDLGGAAAVADVPAGMRALMFLNAGGDLIVSNSARATAKMFSQVRQEASADPAFARRVDDAALYVLRSKERFGLLPC